MTSVQTLLSLLPSEELYSDSNLSLVRSAPIRWDEYLELGDPILISSECGAWVEVVSGLWTAGLSEANRTLLLQQGLNPIEIAITAEGSSAKPSLTQWALLIRPTPPPRGTHQHRLLSGKNYVLTRNREQSQELLDELLRLGATALVLPMLDFHSPDDLPRTLKDLARVSEFDWIVFTSSNGVRFFFERLSSLGPAEAALSELKFACVGPGTAKTLAKHGFVADLIASRHIAEGLLEELEETLKEELSSLSFLVPRAQEAREILPTELKRRGAEVTVVPVYKTVPPPFCGDILDSLDPNSRVLFASASSVENWIFHTQRTDLPCFCIGPITAQAAVEAGLTVLATATDYTIDGLVACLLSYDGDPRS